MDQDKHHKGYMPRRQAKMRLCLPQTAVEPAWFTLQSPWFTLQSAWFKCKSLWFKRKSSRL